jgi:DNA-binding NtrC family response regulator
MGSELFGHERGAYTGAAVEREGAIALAHRGTLFLDEIGELDPLLQAQLLRVVQERSYKRVGSNAWRRSEFRLICATNRDLLQEVHAGRFRGDLYYRIADRTLRLPSLDERRDDIVALAKHFWRSGAADDGAPDFDPALEQFLTTRSYPGNVRDLRRIVRVLRIRHAGIGTVTLGALPEAERPATPMPGDADATAMSPAIDAPLSAPAFVRAIETAIERGIGLKEIGRMAAETAIRVALAREDGNLQRAARRLGVTDRALQIRRANGRPLPFDS